MARGLSVEEQLNAVRASIGARPPAPMLPPADVQPVPIPPQNVSVFKKFGKWIIALVVGAVIIWLIIQKRKAKLRNNARPSPPLIGPQPPAVVHPQPQSQPQPILEPRPQPQPQQQHVSMMNADPNYTLLP